MKHSMKRFAALAVSLILALSFTMTSYAGAWVFDGPENWKWWYREDDGSYPANVWKMIDGSWYHFNEGGYLDVGWYYEYNYTTDTGKYYYLEDTYDSNTGKMQANGSWDLGYTSADGSYVPYTAEFEGGYGPLVLKDPSTGQTIKSVEGTWYDRLFRTIVEECHRARTAGDKYGYIWTFPLPEGWKEACGEGGLREFANQAVGYLDSDVYWYPVISVYADENRLSATLGWSPQAVVNFYEEYE